MGQIQNKYQESRFKSHHINNYIKCKWFVGRVANMTSRPSWPAARSYLALKLKMVCPFTSNESKEERKSEGVCSKGHMQPTKPNLFITKSFTENALQCSFQPQLKVRRQRQR